MFGMPNAGVVRFESGREHGIPPPLAALALQAATALPSGLRGLRAGMRA